MDLSSSQALSRHLLSLQASRYPLSSSLVDGNLPLGGPRIKQTGVCKISIKRACGFTCWQAHDAKGNELLNAWQRHKGWFASLIFTTLTGKKYPLIGAIVFAKTRWGSQFIQAWNISMADRSYVSVRDPPSTLRPPPAGFHYDSPLIIDSSEAHIRFRLPKINAFPKASLIPHKTLSKPIEYIVKQPTPDIAHQESIAKISSKAVETSKSLEKLNLELKMPLKKRRSLHSIILPAFLQSPPSTSPHPSTAPSSFPGIRSQSAPKPPGSSGSSSIAPSVLTKSKSRVIPEDFRSNSPTPFLDEDPFANISRPPSAVSLGEAAMTPPASLVDRTARSPPASQPVFPIKSETTPPLLPFSSPVDRPNTVRPKSSGNGQVRPAYMKPAFVSRPSLPSLDTLAQMNIVIHKKVSNSVNV